MSHIELGLSGGRIVHAKMVELYPAPEVAKWKAMVSKGRQQLGGVSSGLSFWGSPEWAIGGAVVLGALESFLSSAAQKEGLSILERAHATLDMIRTRGRAFPVNDIRKIKVSNPAEWSADAEGPKPFDISKLSVFEKGPFLKRHGLTKDDVQGNYVFIPAQIQWIVLDDPFVRVVDMDDQPLAVRWTALETYRCCD